MSNIFKVSSGLGRYQFSKLSAHATPDPATKTPQTPEMKTSYKPNRTNDANKSDIFRKSDQEIIKQNNNELIMLRENYLKLKAQYEKDRNSYMTKLNDLQEQLRREKQHYMDLYNEYEKLTKSRGTREFYQTNGKSIAVADNIWSLMTAYRQAITNQSRNKNKEFLEDDFDFNPNFENK